MFPRRFLLLRESRLTARCVLMSVVLAGGVNWVAFALHASELTVKTRLVELSSKAVLKDPRLCDYNRGVIHEFRLHLSPVRVVKELMTDADADCRRVAVVLAPWHSCAREFEQDVIDRLSDDAAYVRVAAILALPLLDPQRGLGLVEQIINEDPAIEVKCAAIESLRYYRDLDAVRLLLSQTYRHRSVEVRASVVFACAFADADVAIEDILLDALTSTEIAQPGVMGMFIELDAPVELRHLSADSMARLPKSGVKIKNALRKVLDSAVKPDSGLVSSDPEFVLRTAVAYCEHHSECAIALDAVRAVCAAKSDAWDGRVLTAISDIGPEAIPLEQEVLDRARGSDDEFVRSKACAVLHRLQSSSNAAREFLLGVLRNGKTPVERAEAAKSIAELFPGCDVDWYDAILSCESAVQWSVFSRRLKDAMICLSWHDKSRRETVSRFLKLYERWPARSTFLVDVLTSELFESELYEELQNGSETFRHQFFTAIAKAKVAAPRHLEVPRD